MKLLVISFFLLSLFSCSSSRKVRSMELPGKKKVRVELEGEDGKMRAVQVPGSTDTTVYDPKSGKKYKSVGWVNPVTYNQTVGLSLKKLNDEELFKKALRCSPVEAILIIDQVRARRKINGIKILALFLNDDRPGLFSKKRKYWWYEKKGEDYEPVEVRVYAAYAMQLMTNVHPSGVTSGVTMVLTPEDYLFYALEGKFAVVKGDVCKAWLGWWDKNKKDYI